MLSGYNLVNRRFKVEVKFNFRKLKKVSLITELRSEAELSLFIFKVLGKLFYTSMCSRIVDLLH